MTETTPTLSETAIALLKYSKRLDNYFALETLVKELREVLGPIYHPEMRLGDIQQVTLNALLEIQKEPRFQIPSHDFFLDLLRAPIRHAELKLHGSRELVDDWMLTITDVVLCQIRHMLQTIRNTNIGWCRDVLFGEKQNA